MKEQKRAWIFCRINDKNKYELLEYQYNLLTNFAHSKNYAIVGSSSIIDSGKNIESINYYKLLDAVINEFVDYVLAYSTHQLFVDKEMLEGFELISLMHHVSIITYK